AISICATAVKQLVRVFVQQSHFDSRTRGSFFVANDDQDYGLLASIHRSCASVSELRRPVQQVFQGADSQVVEEPSGGPDCFDSYKRSHLRIDRRWIWEIDIGVWANYYGRPINGCSSFASVVARSGL